MSAQAPMLLPPFWILSTTVKISLLHLLLPLPSRLSAPTHLPFPHVKRSNCPVYLSAFLFKTEKESGWRPAPSVRIKNLNLHWREAAVCALYISLSLSSACSLRSWLAPAASSIACGAAW